MLSISLGDMISIVFLTWRAGLLRQYRPLGNDRGLAKGMIHYSVPLMPTAVMWWIINVSDTFMVTAIHGSAANGVYSFAYMEDSVRELLSGFSVVNIEHAVLLEDVDTLFERLLRQEYSMGMKETSRGRLTKASS